MLLENYGPIKVFSHDIPLYFAGAISELNYIFGYKQIQNIIFTLKLINANDSIDKYIDKYKTENITKCIEWCKINNMPYNKSFKHYYYNNDGASHYNNNKNNHNNHNNNNNLYINNTTIRTNSYTI
jgi:hypothetical protein